MEGYVERVLLPRGFAFVRGDDNNVYFLHAMDFREPWDGHYLRQGVRIQFTPADDGIRANKLRAKDAVTIKSPETDTITTTKERPTMEGRVVRLVKDKNYGFIRSAANNEYFFHKSALKNITFEELEVGHEVTFEDAIGDKGPRAEEIYV